MPKQKVSMNEFARIVSVHEGKKKQVDIAQIKEVLKVANRLTDGELYKCIRKHAVYVKRTN